MLTYQTEQKTPQGFSLELSVNIHVTGTDSYSFLQAEQCKALVLYLLVCRPRSLPPPAGPWPAPTCCPLRTRPRSAGCRPCQSACTPSGSGVRHSTAQLTPQLGHQPTLGMHTAPQMHSSATNLMELFPTPQG